MSHSSNAADVVSQPLDLANDPCVTPRLHPVVQLVDHLLNLGRYIECF